MAGYWGGSVRALPKTGVLVWLILFLIGQPYDSSPLNRSSVAICDELRRALSIAFTCLARVRCRGE